MDEKCKNILIHNILFRSFIGPKLLNILFDKRDGFMRDYDYYLALEDIIPFMIGLDIP